MANYQIVMLVFAALMFLGAIMGYRAGSKVSLVAGSLSALVMMAAFLLSMSNPFLGSCAGSVVALILAVSFTKRLATTKKFMPSGMLLVVSLVTCGLLGYFAMQLTG